MGGAGFYFEKTVKIGPCGFTKIVDKVEKVPDLYGRSKIKVFFVVLVPKLRNSCGFCP